MRVNTPNSEQPSMRAAPINTDGKVWMYCFMRNTPKDWPQPEG